MFEDKDETIEVEDLVMVHETGKAYLFRDTDTKKEYWIPKSQVVHVSWGDEEEDPSGVKFKKAYNLEIPLWLAEEKGLA